MQGNVDDEVWQIDPMTSNIRPAEGLLDPVVVVVEAQPALSAAIAEVCAFLRVRIEHATNAQELGTRLPLLQPIAVLGEFPDISYPIYDLFMVIADYDPDLPLLMVIEDEPLYRGALESSQRLWQLTEVRRLAHRPGIRTLIDFLFLAGRKHGSGRMMPI